MLCKCKYVWIYVYVTISLSLCVCCDLVTEEGVRRWCNVGVVVRSSGGLAIYGVISWFIVLDLVCMSNDKSIVVWQCYLP